MSNTECGHGGVTDVVERARVAAAAVAWSTHAPMRAKALVSIARALDTRRAEIIALAAAETALYERELDPEFDRMTGTLRMFAELLGTHAWRRDTHSPCASDGSSIGPNHDLRSMLIPLGDVVAVFGASNFPLAYGACGGDTASALAAGCAVVVKEHPAHPKTGRLIASIARSAIATAGASEDLLGYVLNEDPADFSIARQLVQHPSICAAGFTGSTKGGLAIEKLARERADLGMTPIPVFAEMGSVNPVFVLPGAMATRGEAIADQLADAVFARNGQQCTKPGVVFFERQSDDILFTERLYNRFRDAPSRAMLAPWIAAAYRVRVASISAAPGTTGEITPSMLTPEVLTRQAADARLVAPSLWLTTLAFWQSSATMRQEVFGPALLWVGLESFESVCAGAAQLALEGSLTLSIFFDPSSDKDVALARALLDEYRTVAGRIIFNGVPTGVRVCDSMVHAGPYPATNQPHTTAVGPRAIERWCRPVCFQNSPGWLFPHTAKA